MTAHILGGAVIGASPADGVIDPYHRVLRAPGAARGGRRGGLAPTSG